jgi:hypothetical protein
MIPIKLDINNIININNDNVDRIIEIITELYRVEYYKNKQGNIKIYSPTKLSADVIMFNGDLDKLKCSNHCTCFHLVCINGMITIYKYCNYYLYKHIIDDTVIYYHGIPSLNIVVSKILQALPGVMTTKELCKKIGKTVSFNTPTYDSESWICILNDTYHNNNHFYHLFDEIVDNTITIYLTEDVKVNSTSIANFIYKCYTMP